MVAPPSEKVGTLEMLTLSIHNNVYLSIICKRLSSIYDTEFITLNMGQVFFIFFDSHNVKKKN